MKQILQRRPVLFLIYLVAMTPAWVSLYQLFGGGLGANPVEKLLHRSGFFALNFLILVLILGPFGPKIKSFAGKSFKKETGLVSLAYAIIHFLIFIVAEHFFDLTAIFKDIAKRPYITVGFLSFLILAVLGATSTRNSKKRLGPLWKKIHRFVYVAGAFAVVHFLWQSKAFEFLPWFYAAIFLALLVSRVVFSFRKN